MIVVATESGSVYELDYEEKRIRRVSGREPVHYLFGEDGAWKPFLSIDYPKVTERLVIVFHRDYKGTLITSRVIRIDGQVAA